MRPCHYRLAAELLAVVRADDLTQAQIETKLCYTGAERSPYFFVVPHPAAREMTKRFSDAVGAHLREITGEL
jgi:hypothetical protein